MANVFATKYRHYSRREGTFELRWIADHITSLDPNSLTSYVSQNWCSVARESVAVDRQRPYLSIQTPAWANGEFRGPSSDAGIVHAGYQGHF